MIMKLFNTFNFSPDRKEDLSAQLETGGIENWSMYQNVVGHNPWHI